MPKFLSERARIEQAEYHCRFYYTFGNGGGYSFLCDKDGLIFRERLEFAGASNLKLCEEEESNGLMRRSVQKFEWSYWEPAVIECDRCGCLVTLHGFTNTCDTCGADYNMSGQLLAPRSQWGEETGETAGEILMGGKDAET